MVQHVSFCLIVVGGLVLIRKENKQRYAFSYISIYGCGYISAAKRSWHLLMDRGCVAIVNDSFVGGVTMAASVVHIVFAKKNLF